jgi:thioredoxin 2
MGPGGDRAVVADFMTENPPKKITVRCGSCLTLNRVPQDKLDSSPKCGSCKGVLQVPRQPVHGKKENFDRDVAYWPETLLVMFWSPWCLYCKIYDPLVADLAREKAGRIKVLRIDTETEPYLTQKMKVTKTPTFLVYKNGVFAVRMDGAPKEKTEFETWIGNLLKYTSY